MFRLSGIPVIQLTRSPASLKHRSTEAPKHRTTAPLAYQAIEPMNKAESFKDLEVYKLAFNIQQVIYILSKRWPREEHHALTDQIRRSSRSIGSNIAESWAKRRYPAHFLSKLTDSDGELQETIHWLETAFACNHLTKTEYDQLTDQLAQTGRLLGSMINRHEAFCF